MKTKVELEDQLDYENDRVRLVIFEVVNIEAKDIAQMQERWLE